MSGAPRAATDAEAARVWPAVQAARIFDRIERYEQFRAAGPWRVRVTPAGEASLLEPWRTHLDVLAIRGLWCSERRVAAFVDDAVALAAAHGYRRVLSPLLPQVLLRPYQRAGMRAIEPVVALQGSPATQTKALVPTGVELRRALERDVEAILAVDASGFAEFWRYGPAEITRSVTEDRLVVAEESGRLIGYTLSTLSRGVVTLARLVVAPDARRRGVARALLADVAGYAERAGASQIALCTQVENEASRALYAAAGYTELPDPYAFAIAEVVPTESGRS